jgi:thiol-disulfide isomerase/thioredoxin
MVLRRWTACATALALLAACGCPRKDEPPIPPQPADTPPAATDAGTGPDLQRAATPSREPGARPEVGGTAAGGAGQAPPPGQQEVHVEPVDLEGLRRAVARHKGRVVLVDFWATWCDPCREIHPLLAEWQEKHRDAGLTVLSVSVDTPDTLDSKVRLYLSRRPLPFEHYIVDVPVYDDFVTGVSPEWAGGVPALLLYDRAGELVFVAQGTYSTDDAEQRLLALLAETG